MRFRPVYLLLILALLGLTLSSCRSRKCNCPKFEQRG